MDHRDRPRMTPAEGRPRDPLDADIDAGVDVGDDTPWLRRFPRLIGPPEVKRFAPHRLALGAVAAVAVLALAAALGTQAVRSVIAYVHAHPSYQLSFREVVLDPPPPPWFRGGAEAFLENVWSPPNEPRTFSTLDLDKKRLSLLFLNCAWVQKLLRVTVGHPNRITVRLEYREPVAVASCPDGSEAWVDREGVLLPPDDIDREAVGPIVGLHGFPPPSELRFGEVWSRVEPRWGTSQPEPLVEEAAALAGFLRTRLNDIAESLPRKPSAVVQLHGERGLIVQITYGELIPDSLLIYWGSDPLADGFVRDFNDQQKWTMLRDWIRRTAPGHEGKPTLLRFTRQGVVVDTRTWGDSTASFHDRRLNGPTRNR
jgi:hypothetical protein